MASCIQDRTGGPALACLDTRGREVGYNVASALGLQLWQSMAASSAVSARDKRDTELRRDSSHLGTQQVARQTGGRFFFFFARARTRWPWSQAIVYHWLSYMQVRHPDKPRAVLSAEVPLRLRRPAFLGVRCSAPRSAPQCSVTYQSLGTAGPLERRPCTGAGRSPSATIPSVGSYSAR